MTDIGWCVVQCARAHEYVANATVIALGYETWLPTYYRIVRGNRYDGSRRIRSRTDTCDSRPLFPGYLFVAVPYGAIARDIDSAHGVHRLMRYAPPDEMSIGKPKRIGARIIRQLQEIVEMGIWDDGDGLRYGPDHSRFQPNTRVRTPSGIVATVLRLDDRGRATLLTSMLGTERIIRGVDSLTLEVAE